MANEAVAPRQRLRILAPAKINLFLRVTGQRADGYHTLQTVFQFIDLCDEIELTTRTDGLIERETELPGVDQAADLSVRAARALQLVTGIPLGVNIRIEKRIPMGGGLGGGSSNAASVLLGLNELWGLGLKPLDLARIGLELGADVPVFIHGRATWAEGVGERFLPIELTQSDFLLALPAVEIPTAEVFTSSELTRDCVPLTIASFPMHESQRNVRHFMVAGNACEAVVRPRYQVVADTLDWLGQWGVARMTGTGAACFAAPDDVAIAAALVAQSVPCPVMRVRGLNLSPALQALPPRVS